MNGFGYEIYGSEPEEGANDSQGAYIICGPLLISVAIFGIIGNVMSMIIFTRIDMWDKPVNLILFGMF